MTLRKDMEDLVEECRRNGWIISNSGRHYRLTPPNDEPIVFASKTPSDHRTIQNTRALIKRSTTVH